MGAWAKRDLLWINRTTLSKIIEFFFDPGVSTDTDFFDPFATAGGTLSNGNLTVANGKAGLRNNFHTPLDSTFWCVEIHIDAATTGMQIGMSKCGQSNPYDSTHHLNFTFENFTCFWTANGAYQMNFDEQGTIATYTTNDTLAIGVGRGGDSETGQTGAIAQFFKNGTPVGAASIMQYYSGPPWRPFVNAAGAIATVTTNKSSMLHASAYQAWADALLGDTATLLGWSAPVFVTPPPTTITLSPSSLSASADSASANITATLDNPATAAFHMVPHTTGSGGSFSSSSILFNIGDLSKTFTRTGHNPGSETISVTNDGGLTNANTVALTVTSAGYPELPDGSDQYDDSSVNGDNKMYQFTVAPGVTDLSFRCSMAFGNASLYIKRGSIPTTSVYDFHVLGNNSEEFMTGTLTGTWYVLVVGSDADPYFAVIRATRYA